MNKKGYCFGKGWRGHKFIVGLVSILIILPHSRLRAQEKYSLTYGWGIYELVHIGGLRNFENRSALSLFAGSNLGANEITSWSAGLSFGQVLRRPADWKLKPCYSIGAIFWTHDDEWYFFQTLSFPLMFGLTCPLSPALTLRAEGGAVFSSVLLSDRKQNVQSGYPDRYNGNFRINIIYKLGKK